MKLEIDIEEADQIQFGLYLLRKEHYEIAGYVGTVYYILIIGKLLNRIEDMIKQEKKENPNIEEEINKKFEKIIYKNI